MAAQPVEWVLVICYNRSAHRATYGRRLVGKDKKYTKDYIQLPKRKNFLDEMPRLWSAGESKSVLLTYQWPKGTRSGAFVFISADRPHLKWDTNQAPEVWKMTPSPSDTTSETIPGDPSHRDFSAAENEFDLLAGRGAGQPYLLAIKLQDEPRTLHLRAYLKDPGKRYAWADLELVPEEIQTLARETSQKKAIKSSLFQSGGTAPNTKIEHALSQLITSANPESVITKLDVDTGHALASYLRNPGYGLFFDPTQNHDAWLRPAPLTEEVAASVDNFTALLEAHFPALPQGDAAAERLETDPDEVDAFRKQIGRQSYEVADSTATVKTRGSAQKAFAETIKKNYGYRCAITSIVTKDFLVASHIVPWSKDQTIRLDPSNGICLSLLVDRAFEKGYLQIEDDLTIRIDWHKVGDDPSLRSQLEQYDGRKLSLPEKASPKLEYLQRRRMLVE
ncbi:MAG: HNH endonuclease [Betaproteobacteria bacterium]